MEIDVATRLEEAEEVLRGLASYLGVGGYNASTVDAKVFDEKIRAGIDMLIRPIQEDRDEVKEKYVGACKLVALMHAAAVGETKGPMRGVVEDVEDLRAERNQLLAACKKLMDAEHYDHFAARMSDSEMEGIEAIKEAIAKAEGKVTS